MIKRLIKRFLLEPDATPTTARQQSWNKVGKFVWKFCMKWRFRYSHIYGDVLSVSSVRMINGEPMISTVVNYNALAGMSPETTAAVYECVSKNFDDLCKKASKFCTPKSSIQ